MKKKFSIKGALSTVLLLIFVSVLIWVGNENFAETLDLRSDADAAQPINQTNICNTCQSSSECNLGQICIPETDYSVNTPWERAADPFAKSDLEEHKNLATNYGGITGWDTFSQGNYISERMVRNGKVYKKETGKNSTLEFINQEQFRCGANCGEGNNIYSVSLFLDGTNITYYLVRNNNIYFKTFPASSYSDNITKILDSKEGWQNYNYKYPNVRKVGGQDSIFSGFDLSKDHLGNKHAYMVRQNLQTNTSFVFHQLITSDGKLSDWKPVSVSNDEKDNPDILIPTIDNPVKIFSIDNYHNTFTNNYRLTVVAKSSNGKVSYKRFSSVPKAVGYCKNLNNFNAYCSNSSPFKCQVDSKNLTDNSGAVIGVAANQPLIYNINDAQNYAGILKETNVDFIRRGVNWHNIEPTQESANWNYGINNGLGLLETSAPIFKENNLEILATITGTAQWASSGSNASNFAAYPPEKIDDWKNFVKKVVNKYGYGNGGGQLIRNWEIWNEPNFEPFLVQREFFDPKIKYTEMLNTAYETIHETDPAAKVWGPTVLFNDNFDNPNADYDKNFALYVIKNGKFDVYSVHIYSDLVSIQKYIKWIRTELDLNGKQNVPIAITEINFENGKEYPYCKVGADSTISENLKQIYTCSFTAGAKYVFWFGPKDYIDTQECKDTNTQQVNKHGFININNQIKPAGETLKALGAQ